MECKILAPGELIASDPIRNPKKLLEYYTLISEGKKVSPCIIGHSHLIKNHPDYAEIPRDLKQRLKELVWGGAEYFMFDGNHRASAYALRHEAVPCLEIFDESDLVEIERMSERGEINPFLHTREYYEPEFRFLGGYKPTNLAYRLVSFEHMTGTIPQILEDAIREGKLPPQIVEKYRSKH